MTQRSIEKDALRYLGIQFHAERDLFFSKMSAKWGIGNFNKTLHSMADTLRLVGVDVPERYPENHRLRGGFKLARDFHIKDPDPEKS